MFKELGFSKELVKVEVTDACWLGDSVYTECLPDPEDTFVLWSTQYKHNSNLITPANSAVEEKEQPNGESVRF